MNNICVLGSLNMDLVMYVEHLPSCGETILSEDFKRNPGGKGANQAVSAARLGAKVFMIGKIGEDENGSILVENLLKDKIDTKYVFKDSDNSTGMAIITVDREGSNTITVVSGSNMSISQEDIENSRNIIENSKVIISQFETPIETTIEAFRIARESGVTTILNPAPAREFNEKLLKYTDIIVPNEIEAGLLTGVKISDSESLKKAGNYFLDRGCRFSIITLGEKGAAIVSKDRFEIIPAFKVKAIDTTAAGDAFIGALANKIGSFDKIDFDSLIEAVRFGNMVSSIAVQKQGAQPSLPYIDEVNKCFMEMEK